MRGLMRIGMISGEFPPMEGGVGAYTEQLGRTLADQGHEIHVITSTRAMPGRGLRSIWDVKEPIEQPFGYLHPRIGRWWWGALGTIARIAIRYDLQILNLQFQAAAYDMIVPAIYFLPWRMRGITQIVTTFHDLRVPYLFPRAGSVRKKVVYYLAKNSKAVVATNEEDRTELLDQGLPANALRVIPIGSNVTASKLHPEKVARLRKGLGLDAKDKLIGYFGFLNESKGADVLLRAFAHLDPSAHLVFIGGQTGSSDAVSNRAFLEDVQVLIDELSIADRIHWSGFLEDEQVSNYLYACDLVAMPYRDGASLRRGTLMAILSHGRPLISTTPRVPVSQFKHLENVYFVPVEDPEELYRGMVRLLSDADLRDRLGRHALALSSEFGWEKIGRETANFFQSILDG